MGFPKEVLLHKAENFSYETLNQQLHQHGSKNIAKLELFLWDLEMFLQIQRIMESKVVLKGGAAVQFYLPIKYQRSSVDIDMICSVSKEEVEGTIRQIENRFNADKKFFRFHSHKPEKPQTSLPLLTYYVGVPSECKPVELAAGPDYGQASIQEIKVEFLLSESSPPVFESSSPQIFAAETNKTYQIFPLNNLLADKLTTLGPNTIGIQINRADEQIKQLYDIDALITWNIDKIDLMRVKDSYFMRAKMEAQARGIEFDATEIFKDVENQLEELSLIDFPANTEYKKRIDDFQSLYLRRSINRNVSGWAIVGRKLMILFELLMEGDNKMRDNYVTLFDLDKNLGFEILAGPKRGQVVKDFKESITREFGSYCRVPINQIKGKHQKRIFWEILSIQNMVDVIGWVGEFFKGLDLDNRVAR